MKKEDEYAVKLIQAVKSVFDEESENYIDPEEFEDSDNTTAFMHALANMMPCQMYRGLTADKVNILEFNHIANKLAFQFTKKAD
jgi:hypothetical protein